MSRKHWLATYGEKIPAEIDPNAHRSVLDLLETAMRRYADKPAFTVLAKHSVMPTPTGCRVILPLTCRTSSA